MDGWMESQVAVSLLFLPPCPSFFISLNVGGFFIGREQAEIKSSLSKWSWHDPVALRISFKDILHTKQGWWGLAVEFPVGSGSFKTQIKQGGNAQRMNMNWCWALPGLASFDKVHFFIGCQLFILFKYVSSDEHVRPETDTHRNTHMNQSMRKGCRHQSVGQKMRGQSCAQRAVSHKHPFAWSLTDFLCCPCRRSSFHKSNLTVDSAQHCGNVSTRQEPRASLVPLLISSTWNCLTAI